VFLKYVANLLRKNQKLSYAGRKVCVLRRYDRHAFWV